MTSEANEANVGYCSRTTAMVDCDNMQEEQVEAIAQYLLSKFALDGYCIINSSEGHYHLVFDRMVTWETALKVIAEAALLANSGDIMRWLCKQIQKGVAVLRISPKSNIPTVVLKIVGEKRCNIKTYLELRALLQR